MENLNSITQEKLPSEKTLKRKEAKLRKKEKLRKEKEEKKRKHLEKRQSIINYKRTKREEELNKSINCNVV